MLSCYLVLWPGSCFILCCFKQPWSCPFLKFFCPLNVIERVEDLRPATLLKKRLQQRCFPVNFVKFLRTPFLQNTSRRLLLFVTHLTVSFCKEVLYVYSNLFLLEKSTKTQNFAIFSFCRYILYSVLGMYSIDQNINKRNHVSLVR